MCMWPPLTPIMRYSTPLTLNIRSGGQPRVVSWQMPVSLYVCFLSKKEIMAAMQMGATSSTPRYIVSRAAASLILVLNPSPSFLLCCGLWSPSPWPAGFLVFTCPAWSLISLSFLVIIIPLFCLSNRGENLADYIIGWKKMMCRCVWGDGAELTPVLSGWPSSCRFRPFHTSCHIRPVSFPVACCPSSCPAECLVRWLRRAHRSRAGCGRPPAAGCS